jgi:hypothetical protein
MVDKKRMNQKLFNTLNSLNIRIKTLEHKLGNATLGMHNGESDNEESHVTFYQRLKEIDAKYRIDTLTQEEDKLLNTSFEDEYHEKLTINQDDILAALLLFVDTSDETKKRIVGHLISKYDEDWAYRAYHEH